MDSHYINTTLPELCEQLFSQLEALGYSQSTIAGYRAAVNGLQTFMEGHNEKYYSKEIGMKFLAECQLKGYSSRSNRSFKTTVNRLNDMIEGRPYRKVHSSNRKQIPSLFHTILEDYQAYLRHSGNKESTVKVRSTYCAEFLCNLESYGLKSLDELQPEHIYHALTDTSSREGFCEKIPKFLKYLYRVHITAADYSPLVPRFYTPKILPSVYTETEIRRVLEKADTSTAIGIRDYAILVMIALLGIRASDICHLFSDNIYYGNENIRIMQVKTGNHLILPLLPEVRDALDNYIQNARPTSKSPYIFLGSSAPFMPLSRTAVWSIVSKYFEEAGICIEGKRHGPHSLRSSLASALVNENVPYSVVQEILGHEDPNSTKHYAKIDIERLRIYALEVPPPSGAFAGCLGVKGGAD